MAPKMGRFKKSPSHYPALPSAIVSFFRSGSAAAVVSMMSFFIYHLRKDQTHNYPVPKTFVILLVAGAITFTFSCIKFFALCSFGVKPLFNLVLDTLLVAMWTAGGISLGYFAGHTLRNACDFDNWGQAGRGGQFVCRVYKGLFACVFIAWFFTICAIILDIHVRRKQTRLGKYQGLRDPDHKALINNPDEDPWAVPLAPSPQPEQRYYQQGARYESLGNPTASSHSRTPSAEPLREKPPTYDTSYHGAEGQLGEAAEFYDPHGAGLPKHQGPEGP